METYNSVTETKLESEVSKDTTDMSEEVLRDLHPTQSEDEEKTQQGNENSMELMQSKIQTDHNQREAKVTPLDSSNIQPDSKSLQQVSSKITSLLFTELFFKQKRFL